MCLKEAYNSLSFDTGFFYLQSVSLKPGEDTRGVRVAEPMLYVYESVELELSLTTVAVEDDELIEDDFTCLIKLHAGKSLALSLSLATYMSMSLSLWLCGCLFD